MSFGQPPNFSSFKPTPPDRGSFPLDHDKQCYESMKNYLSCLKKNKNETMNCRELAKQHLECRMNNELMKKDDFDNLGFAEDNKNKKKESNKTINEIKGDKDKDEIPSQ
ncbi:hypothetical protein K502DRAFT_306559 [Neoconidiobolus thromboides FSU 785]|nr:hypothetical protein K502DRAFT_306559 [Neoconidiobolus thromboides FSU 785]